MSLKQHEKDERQALTKRIQTKNYTIDIFDDGLRGYFEHDHHGDAQGGGLWFQRNEQGQLEIVDYDGVFELPEEVWLALEGMGYSIPEEFK